MGHNASKMKLFIVAVAFRFLETLSWLRFASCFNPVSVATDASLGVRISSEWIIETRPIGLTWDRGTVWDRCSRAWLTSTRCPGKRSTRDSPWGARF